MAKQITKVRELLQEVSYLQAEADSLYVAGDLIGAHKMDQKVEEAKVALREATEEAQEAVEGLVLWLNKGLFALSVLVALIFNGIVIGAVTGAALSLIWILFNQIGLLGTFSIFSFAIFFIVATSMFEELTEGDE